MARQWTQRWSGRIGVAVCGVLLLAGCTSGETEPEPPAPKVSTEEFQQRLTEHLSRMVAGTLEPEARASAPSHSQSVGCADLPGGGPSWGVRPRAELTVSAGEKAGKYLDDVEMWVLREDFGENTDRWRAGTPDVKEITAEHDDGTELLLEMARDSGQFTIALTGPCTWPPDRPGGPPSSGQLSPLPPPSGPRPTRSEESDQPCTSPKLYVYNLSSQPFAGRGPHLMMLVDYSDEKEMEYAEISLPRAWKPRYQPGTSERNLDQVQLLVCVRVTATRDSRQDVTCNYANEQALLAGGHPFTFDLFESVYHVAVREARSGKLVSEFTVPGRQGAEDSCPFRMSYNRKLARGIDENALQRRLRPLVEARR